MPSSRSEPMATGDELRPPAGFRKREQLPAPELVEGEIGVVAQEQPIAQAHQRCPPGIGRRLLLRNEGRLKADGALGYERRLAPGAAWVSRDGLERLERENGQLVGAGGDPNRVRGLRAQLFGKCDIEAISAVSHASGGEDLALDIREPRRNPATVDENLHLERLFGALGIPRPADSTSVHHRFEASLDLAAHRLTVRSRPNRSACSCEKTRYSESAARPIEYGAGGFERRGLQGSEPIAIVDQARQSLEPRGGRCSCRRRGR